MENVSTELTDLDLVTFGKRTGSTYLEVYTNDQNYCRWVMTTVETEESSMALKRFAHYVQTKMLQETYDADEWSNMQEDFVL